MQLKGLIAVGIAVAMMTGCGSFEIPTKKIDYKSTAPKLPQLEIPPDLSRPASDDRYAMPDINPKGTATFSDYSRERQGKPRVTAGDTGVLPKVTDARVERSGSQRWLVVRGVPAKIWPVVKDFWQENGFIVNVEKPEAGVMETDWAENRAKVPQSGLTGVIGRALNSLYSTSERDKFRTRLEPGTESGTTEIYISHRGMEEVYISEGKDQLRWQPRAADPGLEVEMLRRLMVRFGVEQEQAKTRVAVAQAAPQASLTSASGGRTLTLTDPFDRAWRRVGLALDRVGFTVEDRDRSKGLYYVRYIDPDKDTKTTPEKQGWFSRMFSWGSSTPAQSREQYRVLVQGVANGAAVQVLDKSGARDQSDTANRILNLLYEQLR